jgi:nucleotide-binding universal stress UspA family protein
MKSALSYSFYNREEDPPLAESPETPEGARNFNHPLKEVDVRNIKTILCAVDLSQHSEVVATYAVAFAEAFSARVIAVYIAPALTQYVGFHVPPSSIENFVSEIVTGAEQNMKEFVEANFKGIEAEGKVANGYAAEEILHQAEICEADLIVMGTHGRVGIDRILFGSVAERIVKSSLIPVMTVRPTTA